MVRYAAVESHLGGTYVMEINRDEDIELIEEVCETCLDCDWVFGVFDTEEEAEKHLKQADNFR